MEQKELTRKIKEIVLNHGFGLVGVASVDLNEADISFWRSWVGHGCHGEMEYLANPVRESVKKWHPEARSVVMAAYFYKGPSKVWDSAQKFRGDSPTQTVGRIASYAVYPDYHQFLKKKMQAVAGEIQNFEPHLQARAFVGSGVVLERSYARLAGLGWIGKNAMLINKDKGSYCFLAGLAVNLDLEKDRPETSDLCGNCKLCIEACPTQCLRPYEIDASRCISYLTIEKKALRIEPELAARMENRIFGCDKCQQVCPYNRMPQVFNQGLPAGLQDAERRMQDAQYGEQGEWKPAIVNTLDLKTALNWNQEDFNRHFAGLPVLRAGWRGFLRNVLVAAGNSGNPALLTDVERWAKEGDDEIAPVALSSLTILREACRRDSRTSQTTRRD